MFVKIHTRNSEGDAWDDTKQEVLSSPASLDSYDMLGSLLLAFVTFA